MKRSFRLVRTRTPLASLALIILASGLYAKRKQASEPNAVTSRVFQLLDLGHNGKLEGLYLLADTYKDSNNPNLEYRRVLRVDYDKDRVFGKLTLYVRSVGKLDPQQLQAYTVKQIFDFGESDSEKFVKTSDGDFGSPGDLYLKASDDGVLASAPISEDIRKEYDALISQYVMPAIEKNSAAARPGGR